MGGYFRSWTDRLREDRRSLLEDPSLSINSSGLAALSHFKGLHHLNVLNKLYPRGTTLQEVAWSEIAGKRMISENIPQKPSRN